MARRMTEKSLIPTTRRILIPIVSLLIVIILALSIGAMAVLVTGKAPLLAIQELIQGAIGTRNNLAATVTRSIPIIITGIGAAVAFKAGQFNLGLEGQMEIGRASCRERV